MQAWVSPASWEERSTLSRPTYSGVIGLVANVLGMEIDDDLRALAALDFAVRADRPGDIMSDDQIAGGGTFPFDVLTGRDVKPEAFIYAAARKPAPDVDGVLKAPWRGAERTTTMLTKHYIADGAFLAGLTGDEALCERIHAALQEPERLPFLGRRNCAPGQPLAYGMTDSEDWARSVPLLPRATDSNPQVWRTHRTLVDGAHPVAEGIPTTYRKRDHRPVYISSERVTPPVQERAAA